MMGFRPNRGCHTAIQKLNVMLEERPTNYILDADIKGYFQHINHEWAVKFIESRIKDPNITRLDSKSRNGKFRVKRKTSKKKFAKKCKEVHRWIGRMRTMELAEIIKKLNQMLVGEFMSVYTLDSC